MLKRDVTVTGIRDVRIGKKLGKLLSGLQIGVLKSQNDTYTKSGEETLSHWFQSHFPDCLIGHDVPGVIPDTVRALNPVALNWSFEA